MAFPIWPADECFAFASRNETRTNKENGKWQDTPTFRRDDLPIVAKVVDMAYAWIWGQETPAPSDQPIE